MSTTDDLVAAATEMLDAMDYFGITNKWMNDVRMGQAISGLKGAVAAMPPPAAKAEAPAVRAEEPHPPEKHAVRQEVKHGR